MLTILDGSSFFATDETGDVEARGSEGCFHEDMRHLSRWQLRIDGAPLVAVSSRAVDYYSARFDLVRSGDASADAAALAVRRDRFVAGGLHEDVTVTNLDGRPRTVLVEVRYGADFADLQALQRGMATPQRARGRVGRDARSVTFGWDGEGRPRATRISFSRDGRVTPTRARFEATLRPGESWSLCADVVFVAGDEQQEPLLRCGAFHRPLHDMPMSFDEWMLRAPRIEAASEPIRRAVEQGLADLAALRLRPNPALRWSLPAGGLPWFMALFGRDTIWAAYQALPFHSEPAQTALVALAEHQAQEDDAYRDAEPGKILHELRRGALAESGRLPHHPYYGSHDSTPLYVILLDEYHRFTGDADLVRRLEPTLRAALEWIEHHGDLDGDGYLEYRRRSPKGLESQCWKDSDSAIQFADGRLAEAPIATCEVQAYAYRARLGAGRLMREVLADAATARRLERDAARLRERFDKDFWHDERRHYVLALDAEKRQVDAMTSNVGHLLFCGIVPDERVPATAARLMASDMFTGWGLRTLSSLDAGYNPLGYHTGSVWPFDCAVAAEGLRRCGQAEAAVTLALALVDACDRFGHRLPELFAGFDRDGADVPSPYPGANRPQAFSAGAPLMVVRTLLGLDVVEGTLVADPIGGDRVGHLALRGMWATGRRQDAPPAAWPPSAAE